MKFKFNGKFNIGGRGNGDWNLECELDADEFIRSCEHAERVMPQVRSMLNELVDKKIAAEDRWHDDRKRAKKLAKRNDKYFNALLANNIDPETGKKFGWAPEPESNCPCCNEDIPKPDVDEE